MIPATNPSGKPVNIVAEVRQPKGTHHLKIRVGREGPDLGDGFGVPPGPEYWYEDFGSVLQAGGEAFLAAAPAFLESEKARHLEDAQRRASRIRSVVGLTDRSWAQPLAEVKRIMDGAEGEMVESGDAEIDAAIDAAEETLGDQ